MGVLFLLCVLCLPPRGDERWNTRGGNFLPEMVAACSEFAPLEAHSVREALCVVTELDFR